MVLFGVCMVYCIVSVVGFFVIGLLVLFGIVDEFFYCVMLVLIVLVSVFVIVVGYWCYCCFSVLLLGFVVFIGLCLMVVFE